MFLSANTAFNHPSVVLDHSAHASADYSDETLNVKFSSPDAHAVAQSTWPTSGNRFILVTTTGSDNGHFVYYMVSSIECNEASLSCVAVVTPEELQDLIEQYELEWGHYQGSSPDSNGAGSGSGSGAGGSNGGSNPSSSGGLQPAASTNTFDEKLDAALGYYTWDEPSFKEDLADFAEGLTDFDWDHYDDEDEDNDGIYGEDGNIDVDLTDDDDYFDQYDSRAKRRSHRSIKAIRPRASRPRSNAVVSSVRKDSAEKSKEEAGKKKGIFAKAWEGVKKVGTALKTIKSYVDGTPHDFQVNKTFTVPNATQAKYVDQAFWINPNTKAPRKAMEIYQKKSQNDNKKLTAYCVDCGVQGMITGLLPLLERGKTRKVINM